MPDHQHIVVAVNHLIPLNYCLWAVLGPTRGSLSEAHGYTKALAGAGEYDQGGIVVAARRQRGWPGNPKPPLNHCDY